MLISNCSWPTARDSASHLWRLYLKVLLGLKLWTYVICTVPVSDEFAEWFVSGLLLSFDQQSKHCQANALNSSAPRTTLAMVACTFERNHALFHGMLLQVRRSLDKGDHDEFFRAKLELAAMPTSLASCTPWHVHGRMQRTIATSRCGLRS